MRRAAQKAGAARRKTPGRAAQRGEEPLAWMEGEMPPSPPRRLQLGLGETPSRLHQRDNHGGRLLLW